MQFLHRKLISLTGASNLQSRLTEDLSNFRAIDSIINEVYIGLQVSLSTASNLPNLIFSPDIPQRNRQRAESSLKQQVPQIQTELETSMDTLSDLKDSLPRTDMEVSHVRKVYKSGRDKVRYLRSCPLSVVKAHPDISNGQATALVSDLTWLNTEFYERWRSIIFTSSSPVSWRWKIYLRTMFVVSFILCSWLFWIALTGAYRAHRHRLVWGEKLMS